MNKLPRKEGELFKTLVASYETKQYKKGIKTADTILKKFPNHGETLAMKGIILNSQGKKVEGLELVKLGLRNDVKSAVCWHVFGLVHRSDANYKEAAKCYLNALKLDADNQNILRDLSWLQIQTRDYTGFFQTRKRILELKPASRSSWVGFAASAFMLNDYQSCYDIIDKYFDNITEPVDPYEDSELLLFQNKSLEKMGKFRECLDHVEKSSKKIVDKHAVRILKSRFNLFQGNFVEATSNWADLVREEPDNVFFHVGLQCSILQLPYDASSPALEKSILPSSEKSLSEDQIKSILHFYGTLSLTSRTFRKIELALTVGSQNFVNLLKNFVASSLNSGIPSTFDDVHALITSPAAKNRRSALLETALEISNDLIREDMLPITHLWALYFKAQLLDLSGNFKEAISLLDECLEHTPTAIDIYLKKADILEKIGQFLPASSVVEECRKLDLQDRYLNNYSTRMFLRADKLEEAKETIAIFTKHDGEPEKTLFDLQCCWYELEVAESMARQKMWKSALEKFSSVRQHFKDQFNDLFDFHGYCVRKSTLKAYIEVFSLTEKLFSHPLYQRALRGALEIYLYLLDFPEDIDGLGHLSAADRKKERSKLKKKKTKETKDEDQQNEEPDESLMVDKLLPEALDWCQSVEGVYPSLDCNTLAVVSEVFIRHSKPLLAIRPLIIGLGKDDQHPDITVSIARFLYRIKNKKLTFQSEVITNAVKVLLSKHLHVELGSVGFSSYVSQVVQRCLPCDSFSALVAGLKCELLLDKKVDSKILEKLILADLQEFSSSSMRSIFSFNKFLQLYYPQEDCSRKFSQKLELIKVD